MRTLEHFIGGQSVTGTSGKFGEVFDPNKGVVQARVPLASLEELDRAVANAAVAQKEWAQVNPQRRARVMFEFKRLLEVHMDELAHLLSSEHGKVISDAKGDIQRGLEVIEFACGNAFILKPSERDPSVPVRLAELMIEAGLPPGVLNVVHGDKDIVEAILKHPTIKAVSFVGSSDIAQSVYALGAQHGKRVQAMGGAKNHGIVLPDADLDQTVADLIGAAYGSAGERCMALPVVVPVGKETAEALREKLIVAIKGLRIGNSTDEQAHYGPVINAAHRSKIESYIQIGVEEGAELVLDGRGFSLAGSEDGYFLGPSLFDHVTEGMQTYREEIFGPVLQIVRADSFEQALELASKHQYGNGVAIFTRNGDAAREFADRVEVGMVGINVPIPVPVAYHSFGGWKRSGFGDLNQYGMDGVRFYTRTKTITQRWPSGGAVADQSFVIPTMR